MSMQKDDEQPGVLQVLTDPRYRNATYISILLAALNQLSGLNAINFYSGEIFKEVFEGDKGATIGTTLTGAA